MFSLQNTFQQFGFAFLIVITLAIILYIGYNLLQPSECTTCTQPVEGFISTSSKNRDLSLILKKNWNTYISKGQNYLAEIQNPAKNKYVIYQTNIPLETNAGEEISPDDREQTYLSIPMKLEKNQYYQFTCIIQNDISDTQIDWETILQISQHSSINPNNIFIPNKQIFSQVLHWSPPKSSLDQLLPSYWNSIQILFKTSATNDPYNFTFILPQNATKQYIIYRDLKVIHKTLHLFPMYEAIESYVDSRIPESYNGNGSIWRDLSDNDHSLRWNLRPFWSNGLFHLGVHKLLLSGPASDFFSRGQKPDDVEFSIILTAQMNANQSGELEYIPIVTFYGNQNIAFELQIPNQSHQPLRIICADQMYQTENIYDPTLFTTYIMTYSNQKVSLWIQNLPYFQDLSVGKIYMDSKNFKLNSQRTFNGTLTSFMFYNIEIHSDDVGNIINALDNYPDFYQQLQKGKTLLNIFIPGPTNQEAKEKKSKERFQNFVNICPQIRINSQTREYEIYSKQKNPFRSDLGQLGVLFSSQNKQEIFSYFITNFPNCPLPNLLTDKPNNTNCPFRGERNPCISGACNNVIWNSGGFMDQNYPESCRYKINQYCEANIMNDDRDIDPMCQCWRQTNQYTPQCNEIKRTIRCGKSIPIIPHTMFNAQYPGGKALKPL
jgi:hypothetical protein